MATATSFKQECPICEALVPIRDPKLIGKKIKCPKCEGPFVVKAPADEEDEAEEGVTEKPAKKAKAAGNGKVTDKKPVKAAAKKGKASKDDDDDTDVKKKKQKKGSNTLMVGGGLAVVAVAALGIGGYFLFKGKSEPKKTTPVAQNQQGTPQPGIPNPNDTKDPDKTGGDNTIAEDKSGLPDPTSLLPGDATAVMSVNVDKLGSSGVWRSAMQPQGPFSEPGFKKVFGFPLRREDGKGVSRIAVAATSGAKGWVFSVLRSAHKLDQADLIARLKLVEVKDGAGGPSYYLVGRQFDSVGNLLFKANRARSTYAAHFVDAQTLVFADEEPLKKFLQDRAKGADAPADGAKKETAATPYQNVKAELKELLDKVEKADAPALICMAGDIDTIWAAARPMLGGVVKQGAQQLTPLLAANRSFISPQIFGEGFDKLVKSIGTNPEGAVKSAEELIVPEVQNAALALSSFTQDKLSLAVALEMKSDGKGEEWHQTYIKPLLDLWANPTGGTGTGTGTGTGSNTGTTGPASRPPPGGMPTSPGPMGPASNGPASGNMGSMGPGTMGMGSTGDEPKSDAPITVTPSGKILAATFTVPTKTEYDLYTRELGKAMVQARIESDLANTAPRYHQLATALSQYVQKNGHFPRGTQARKEPDLSRPESRVSWMADLLPFLPDAASLDVKIDLAKDWFDKRENLNAAKKVVPQFVVRGKDTAFRSTYPALPDEYGVTHFVGMAGVGADAATYQAGDKTVEDKLGIFGYERVTKMGAKDSDIPKDRQDKVIALIQVPPDFRAPWLAGGGATVRGVAEDDKGCVQPFVSSEYKIGDKVERGTFAIMADGKVRFIRAGIDPALFRSMCTIKGPDKIDKFNELVPEVPDEDLTVQVLAGEADKPGQEKSADKGGAPAGWKTYTSREGAFSSAFPESVKVTEKTEKASGMGMSGMPNMGMGMSGSSTVTFSSKVSGAENSSYSVKAMIYPENGGDQQAAESLKSAKAEWSRTAGSGGVRETDARAGSTSGWEITAKTKDGTTKERGFAIRNRSYLVTVTNADKVPDKDVATFFDSFRITASSSGTGTGTMPPTGTGTMPPNTPASMPPPNTPASMPPIGPATMPPATMPPKGQGPGPMGVKPPPGTSADPVKP